MPPPMAREQTPPRDSRHRAPERGADAAGVSLNHRGIGDEPRPAGPVGHPSDALRRAVTTLLSIYLVGLALCVAGNTASGTSRLVGTLKDRFFAPWMVPPWLDLGHDTRLTYGLPEDADHHLEIRPSSAAARRGRGRGASTAIRFPAPGDRSERGERWRRLARAAALAEEDPEQAGVLAAAIGAGSFRLAGDDDLSIRVVRSVAPDYESSGAARRSETALDVRVRRVDGELQLIPIPPAEEVAPLVDSAADGGGGG